MRKTPTSTLTFTCTHMPYPTSLIHIPAPQWSKGKERKMKIWMKGTIYGLRDAHQLRVINALAEDLAPKAHIRWLQTACNSSSMGSNALWPPWAPACGMHSNSQASQSYSENYMVRGCTGTQREGFTYGKHSIPSSRMIFCLGVFLLDISPVMSQIWNLLYCLSWSWTCSYTPDSGSWELRKQACATILKFFSYDLKFKQMASSRSL